MFIHDMFDSFDSDFGDGYQANEHNDVVDNDGTYLLVGSKTGVVPHVHADDMSHVCYANDYFSALGNSHELLAMQNPLAHAHEYHCNPFDITGGAVNPELVYVDGYTRSDGTFVESHFRTAPDGVEENNISYWKG